MVRPGSFPRGCRRDSGGPHPVGLPESAVTLQCVAGGVRRGHQTHPPDKRRYDRTICRVAFLTPRFWSNEQRLLGFYRWTQAESRNAKTPADPFRWLGSWHFRVGQVGGSGPELCFGFVGGSGPELFVGFVDGSGPELCRGCFGVRGRRGDCWAGFG